MEKSQTCRRAEPKIGWSFQQSRTTDYVRRAMNSKTPAEPKRADAAFDEYAGNYDEKINEGLSLTGESRTFFAEGRMEWLGRRLTELSVHPNNALDFGCGTGGSIPFLFKGLGVQFVMGLDPSAQSLATAKIFTAGLN